MQFVWRIYAVVYLVLFVVGLGPALRDVSHLSPINLIDMAVFMPVAVIGLWSAAYRHINLPKNGWKETGSLAAGNGTHECPSVTADM